MRRSTHLYCRYCKTNLSDYGAERCDKCHLELTMDRLTFDTSKKVPLSLRFRWFMEIVSFRFNSCAKKGGDAT